MKRVMFTRALLSLALAGFAASAADATSFHNIPVHASLFNPCTGLYVTLDGFAHETINVTETPSGHVNGIDHVDFSDVTAPTPSGTSTTFAPRATLRCISLAKAEA
jgi:hypothetical protein